MSYTQIADRDFWKKNRPECNCGSFALNIASWFAPFDKNTLETREKKIQDLYDDNADKDIIYSFLLELDQDAILQACPWLEAVELEDTAPTDRVVAYRLYVDEDFLERGEVEEDYHFRVRINGFWFEKCGEDPIHFCGTAADEEPWRLSKYLIYDSNILYFRFKT